jgi:2-amino-4-hydroxy-6-hydroxymethyldihydropteridine diphosphokinase
MTFGLALGSNLGDRLAHLHDAVKSLLDLDLTACLLAVAPVYETSPVDCPEGSQAFYNSVIEVASELEPLELLKLIRQIESTLGRPNEHLRNAPRTVDLDILYAEDLILELPELILPHPRMTQRRFVLQPLADIRDDLVLPGQSKCVAELLIELKTDEPPLQLVTAEWLD